MNKPVQPITPVEEQFRIMADTVPVLIWISGPDQLRHFFNAGWLRFTGRTMEEEYGNGWAEGVHPDDRQKCLDVYLSSFNERKEFKMEYRLKRHDGQYRWLVDNGVPRYTAEGTFAGYMGSCMDIDDLRGSEQIKNEYISSGALKEEQFLSLSMINEELAAANEELAAANEELSMTNEELEERDNNISKLVAKLTESERQFSFLVNTMPQQLWTALPDGALDYVNQVICKDFGRSAEVIIGEGWRSFIHPDDLESCLTTWRAALESREEYQVEFRLLFSDGIYRWHLGRALPLIENEEVKMWLGTNTNIEVQKNNEHKKDEFISIASHELKTPVTSIKAYSQLIGRTTDIKQIHSFSKKAFDSVLRLEKLIGDLLDVTKINAGKMNYDIQDFDFRQMMLDSIDDVQHVSPDHQIIIERMDEITYKGDRFRLEQAVNNFLTNAVKYSPGADKVIVNSYIELDNLVVSVKDFGIGIAEAELTRIFDRFYRIDNSAKRFDGLGLGLFISSEILKRHGGSFWIESEPGKGSVFYFRLPLSRAGQKKPIVNSGSFYQSEFITIVYNREKHRLDVDWTGFQSFESVQQGGMLMFDMLCKNNCYKMINDNTHVLGTWSDAADWAGEVWFPMMEKAGLKYFAWIYSPSVFSQLAAKKSVDIFVGNVVTQFFTEPAAAAAWIDSV